MKTKIIYISGNETFEMADIRAAFDEVRATLGLGNDTVLFGVPVDQDDALAQTKSNDSYTDTGVAPVKGSIQVEDSITETVVEPVIEPIVETVKEQQVPQKKTAVKKTKTVKTEPKNEGKTEDKVIPILSVLSANAAPVASIEEADKTETPEVIEPEVLEEYDNTEEFISDDIESEEIVEEDTNEIENTDLDEEIVEPVEEDEDTQSVQISSVEDMITDDEPVSPMEKTLEELLESMTPLREDHAEDTTFIKEENDEEIEFTDEENFTEDNNSDTDATLAQLATEFAENQDKIVVENKNESHGKIGKLKNILPFKKAKREDPGLMGDLFGWAGIAANDDDISIPGFFTNAASKK